MLRRSRTLRVTRVFSALTPSALLWQSPRPTEVFLPILLGPGAERLQLLEPLQKGLDPSSLSSRPTECRKGDKFYESSVHLSLTLAAVFLHGCAPTRRQGHQRIWVPPIAGPVESKDTSGRETQGNRVSP